MLKTILIANALSCLGFGALFALAPAGVADFVGEPPIWMVIILGIGLILNGLNILWVARKTTPSPREIMQFVVGDAFWVIATVALIAAGLWITSPAGIAASLAVAVWVGACGLGQCVYATANADGPVRP